MKLEVLAMLSKNQKHEASLNSQGYEIKQAADNHTQNSENPQNLGFSSHLECKEESIGENKLRKNTNIHEKHKASKGHSEGVTQKPQKQHGRENTQEPQQKILRNYSKSKRDHNRAK